MYSPSGACSGIARGRTCPPPQVAPSLFDVVREGLQRKKVPPENIELYLKGVTSLQRYDKAFQHLWFFCTARGGDPLNMSTEEVSSWILRLAQVEPHQARNAYSAFLVIPGWESIRFTQAIKRAKTLWASTGAKYADFWNAESVLKKLALEPLDWFSVQQVRDRAIMMLRIFHLCRSVDLKQALRATSKFQGSRWILMKRKGARKHSWERLLTVPNKSLCPVHLLDSYVNLTVSKGKKGGSLFLSLLPPYGPLSANSIGRITKGILRRMGVPTGVFGAHSTRGAAVKMYKSMGLPSELVCELGSWKNSEAFSKHYLRLGAAVTAGNILSQKFVHTVPSSQSAEKGGSRSPGRIPDPGRRDLPCGARRQDGPDPPTQMEKDMGGGEAPVPVFRSSQLSALRQ